MKRPVPWPKGLGLQKNPKSKMKRIMYELKEELKRNRKIAKILMKTQTYLLVVIMNVSKTWKIKSPARVSRE